MGALDVWVIDTRTAAGGGWSDWSQLPEREFTGDAGDADGPMRPRAWAGCTHYFGDKENGPTQEWRLRNVSTGATDDPFA